MCLKVNVIVILACWILGVTQESSAADPMVLADTQAQCGDNKKIESIFADDGATDFPKVGPANIYPWVPVNPEDLKVIIDPKVEAAVRLDLVTHAQQSIDIVTYDQRSDEIIGMPLLRAIKDAANRGVKVRFLTSWSAHALKDTFNQVERYLNNPPPAIPIEFHIIGGPAMKMRGWGVLDGIHQKIFIADNKLAMISGRGHGEEYLHWLDTGFLFKGELVTQSVDAYQRLWKILKREGFLVSDKNHSLKTLNSREREKAVEKEFSLMELQAPLHLDRKQTKLVHGLTKWLRVPSIKPKPSGEVYQARLLHFNFLEQLSDLAAHSESGVKAPASYSYEERAMKLQDPVVEEVARVISLPQTKNLKFYSLIMNPVSKLKDVLCEQARNGKEICIYTNGEEAHGRIVPFGIPVGWYASRPAIKEYLDAGIKVFQHIPGLNPDADAAGKVPIYVHRKLAVAGDTVIFGSHNLSMPSSAITDELSVEVVGPKFAQQMRNIFDSNTRTMAKEVTQGEVKENHAFQDHAQDLVGKWLNPLY